MALMAALHVNYRPILLFVLRFPTNVDLGGTANELIVLNKYWVDCCNCSCNTAKMDELQRITVATAVVKPLLQ